MGKDEDNAEIEAEREREAVAKQDGRSLAGCGGRGRYVCTANNKLA